MPLISQPCIFFLQKCSFSSHTAISENSSLFEEWKYRSKTHAKAKDTLLSEESGRFFLWSISFRLSNAVIIKFFHPCPVCCFVLRLWKRWWWSTKWISFSSTEHRRVNNKSNIVWSVQSSELNLPELKQLSRRMLLFFSYSGGSEKIFQFPVINKL